MKRVSIYLLRDNLASYLNEVANSGETIIVEKYKKPIAIINPPKKKLVKKKEFEKFFGFLKTKGDNETGVEYENRVRRGSRERKYMRDLRKRIT
ncbi:hypothetical protein A2954_05360 [Candidatus Roizmanbacteria bacterium RIFCSPLOWO2_01_FULL_37_12]|uniref:Antitoxin n=1 Tax=Candidatus Roizmanbacteria bacterium RIFCSPLOWO2_01_FULL_37_12 TaxID=1802056 RepID=A0A1F7IDG0_9BACT|nr:MAG: hypothetical protein A2768_00210 [Candidatus Roizmanbacteria bacterium RIFCSPHIGHO2_01_FULL_37_16]OGK26450.1 MAG: hypothetical protein A3D76_02985 [Candidatus Roizmanbacteria bacterium RIFCSPHIGHO2_02_FULL_37_9b]OGK41385.1 MAG: hypothetical protein A2954_05360 [Candidatus Roizmanbacteria bacterium RIFCSPLOWO2_01_FULL_37_12]